MARIYGRCEECGSPVAWDREYLTWAVFYGKHTGHGTSYCTSRSCHYGRLFLDEPSDDEGVSAV